MRYTLVRKLKFNLEKSERMLGGIPSTALVGESDWLAVSSSGHVMSALAPASLLHRQVAAGARDAFHQLP